MRSLYLLLWIFWPAHCLPARSYPEKIRQYNILFQEVQFHNILSLWKWTWLLRQTVITLLIYLYNRGGNLFSLNICHICDIFISTKHCKFGLILFCSGSDTQEETNPTRKKKTGSGCEETTRFSNFALKTDFYSFRGFKGGGRRTRRDKEECYVPVPRQW